MLVLPFLLAIGIYAGAAFVADDVYAADAAEAARQAPDRRGQYNTRCRTTSRAGNAPWSASARCTNAYSISHLPAVCRSSNLHKSNARVRSKCFYSLRNSLTNRRPRIG